MAKLDQSSQVIKLDLTWISLFRVITVCLGLVFVYLIRDIIALIFVVFIIVAALNPPVSWLEKSMPRTVAVIVIYLLILAALSIISFIVFKPLGHQINLLSNILPETIKTYIPAFETWKNSQTDLTNILQQGLQTFSGKLTNLTGNIFQTISSVFGGFVTAVTVLVLSFYLLLEESRAKHTLDNILPKNQTDRTYKILNKFSEKMGSWFRGQLLLMLIIGVLDYTLLTIFRVDGSLALGFWGGLTEIIPYIGPILGAVPAVLVVWVTQGPLIALVVGLIMLVAIQWLENHLIVPNVMKKAVGLSPVIIILAILIGGKLMGVAGVIISVPLAALVSVVIQEWENIVKVYRNTN